MADHGRVVRKADVSSIVYSAIVLHDLGSDDSIINDEGASDIYSYGTRPSDLLIDRIHVASAGSRLAASVDQ